MARKMNDTSRFNGYGRWRHNATKELYVQDIDQIEYTFRNDVETPVAVIETKAYNAAPVEDDNHTCMVTAQVGTALRLPALFVRYANRGHDYRKAFSAYVYPLNEAAEQHVDYRGAVMNEAEYVGLLAKLHDRTEETGHLSNYKRTQWPNDNPPFV